jgi:hypothetical protein
VNPKFAEAISFKASGSAMWRGEDFIPDAYYNIGGETAQAPGR